MPVGVTAFLQGPVVEGAVIPQHLAQRLLLADGGPHEELVRTNHPPTPSCQFPSISLNTWCMSPRWEPNPDIRTGRHVTYHLHAHLVFVTKYRQGCLR